MKNVLAVKKIIVGLLTSKSDVITSDKRIKGKRAQEYDELVTLEQLEENTGENVARLDLDNVFLEDNFFEKPVYGQPAELPGQFVTKGQINDLIDLSPTIIEVEPGTNIYTLEWTAELREKHGDIIGDPTVLVKAGNDPPDTWTVLRSTVKYVVDGMGNLTEMKITISNLQAKIIIR